MAVFQNAAITIKVLEPKEQSKSAEKGEYYWGMVHSAAPVDLFKVKVTGTTKVKELKAAIAKEKGYSVESQRIMYFGGELDDSRTLESAGMQNTDDPLLHMIPRA
eukprot:CAMPEP_0197659922 /NCGR_PEP_ID=MMETSP1338-20131121/49715_1 /TAXON_ID=43686 ORGANISM="Pelagodinium beii, Strain RCC1491" /NCGR_SAMPLE_ID=MMETSP1338 /ASSEMBLY_ACC=CAM_ASM_000754 /LENGTH=104 /DNA_ID=CAMNT_0043237113 /DNA_START=54 /DNA_END=368 /DNA_ORIENTATION=+